MKQEQLSIIDNATTYEENKSHNKDHVALTIVRVEKDVIRVLSSLQDEDARFMYNLMRGYCPSIDEVIFQLKKHYGLQDIAIISGKLRQYVLSKADSQIAVAYLGNRSLLRSGNTYGN